MNAKKDDSPPELTVPKNIAEEALKKQLKKGSEYLIREIHTPQELREAESEYDIWNSYNQELLQQFFSNQSVRNEYRSTIGSIIMVDAPFQSYVKRHYEMIEGKITKLKSILAKIDLFPTPKSITTVTKSIKSTGKKNRRVFLVHGHDNELKQEVARLLEKLDLEAIILHERPDRGKTVIEKFEEHSDVSFAVILLTPDDEGRSKKTSELKDRARQNVILELGYFFGKLSRANVCALYKGDIDFPSDILGVLYKPVDSEGAWQINLAREIKAAGLDVDLNKLA